MSEKPKVSILISTYGELAYTKRCLAQLEETLAGKLDYEVLIIDDASKDDTPKFLKSLSTDSYQYSSMRKIRDMQKTIIFWPARRREIIYAF